MTPHPFKSIYTIAEPAKTHTRVATCTEVDCAAYRHGWVTTVDTGSTLGRQQAAYIATCSRRYTTTDRGHGIVDFCFPAGQTCFAVHRVPLERPPLYLVRRGVAAPMRHSSADAWVNDFADNQDRLERLING